MNQETNQQEQSKLEHNNTNPPSDSEEDDFQQFGVRDEEVLFWMKLAASEANAPTIKLQDDEEEIDWTPAGGMYKPPVGGEVQPTIKLSDDYWASIERFDKMGFEEFKNK